MKQNITTLITLLISTLFLTALPAAAETGRASYYASRYNGRRTASGAIYRHNTEMTAAHRTLPFGTCVQVNRLNGNRGTVYVRINDRGPFVRGRIIDLSGLAATRLDMIQAGVVPVSISTVNASNCN